VNTALHFLGYKNESFSVTDTVTHHANNNPGIASMAIFIFVLFFFYGVTYCYGAAKLSYDYNVSIGNGSFFWPVLCYFFAGIYYPYYAIFLNPVCTTASMKGGGKRK
jgi:hypothetical protein